MSTSIKLMNRRHRREPLGWRSRWKLEASFWAGLFVIAWEITPLRSRFIGDIGPVAELVAIGLAGIATVTAMQVKRRLRRRMAADSDARTIRAPNPLSLVDLLRVHGVREFGAMYLYMPMPRRPRHEAAWAWIDTLQSEGLIKGEAWHIKADHVKETVRKSHAHLFTDEIEHVDVYRLDWQTLSDLMSEELA